MYREKRVVIVDPCSFFTAGLTECLRCEGYIVQHIGLASDEQEHLLENANCIIVGPHVCLHRSFDLARKWLKCVSKPRIIFVSPHADDLIFQADAAFIGISACLKHPVTAAELIETLAQVIRGLNLFSPDAMQLALETEPLTRRELDVLMEMNKGLSNDEIAKCLNMCKHTVRTHAQHILQKLRVHSRRDAVYRARHRGLIPHPMQ